MAAFQNISIRNKLTVVQTIATFIAVLLCCVIFVYNDITTFKDSSKSNKYSIAEIVGENSMAALVFNDKDAANKILLHFNNNPSILNAVILDKSGNEFARYIKKGEETFPFPLPDETSGIMEKFFELKFIVSYQIFQEKEFIGTVMLRAELIDLPTIILKYIKVAIIVLLLSIVTALIISVFFQGIITKPLLSLAKNTKEVLETDNYSIRSSFKGTDEIGVLSEGFNKMLGQIEKTSKELELSLTLMRATIESTADGILVVDTAGKISLLNQQFKKMSKVPDEILKTKDDNQALDYIIGQIKDPEKFLNKVKELYANPELESYDVFELKDGTTFERYSIPQRTPQNKIIGRVWSFRDVTIRNRAVEELRQLNEQLEQRIKERTADLTKTQATLQLSEEKYRKIVEETGDAVYSSDYKGFLTYVNPVCKKLTGYTENELVGKHFLELIAPDWKEKVAKFYKEQFDNKVQETSFSFPIITKSGEKKWVEQTVTQLKEGDLITGHNAIVRDITERKKAEDELKKSNDRFFKIFENNSFGMVLVNLETNKFQYVNGFFLTKFGYKSEEVIGKTATEITIIEPESYEKVITLFKQQGYVTDFEALVRKKNREIFWSSSSLQIIKINDVDFFLFSFFDITDRKKAEEEIKQKSEELANTNIELEQFVYVASHDLQEPLRTISNFVSLLEKKYAGNTDTGTEQYLNFIVDATFRMRNLIKDLLDLSRTGRNVVFSEVDCNEALKEVIANMEASIKEKNAKITFQKLPVLKGDPIKLKQLFQNLISNAIKFVKKDVVPEITITVEEKNTEYLFAIKDNGIGIEEQSIKKLFVIFQRLNTATEYPGTGIGLATCKKIVALHNGKIWVKSKFGEGSTFYFTISKKLEAPPGLPQGEENLRISQTRGR